MAEKLSFDTLKGFISNAEYTTLLASIGSEVSYINPAIQCALKHAAYHAQMHKNIDPAIRLFAMVNRGINRGNMAEWLTEHAPIVFKDNTPKFHEKKWKENATTTGLEIEAMLTAAPNWWCKKTTTSEIADTIDVAELLRALVKKVESNNKKTVGKKEVKHGDLLAALSAIANHAQYK